MKATEGLLIAVLLLSACGHETGVDATEATGGSEPVGIVPALVSPSEIADPAEPPSYEVAIASAAADRNKALDRCLQQPEAVRTQCEQEANAAFSELEAGMQDLRGNQQ